jgi:hypothetical protein
MGVKVPMVCGLVTQRVSGVPQIATIGTWLGHRPAACAAPALRAPRNCTSLAPDYDRDRRASSADGATRKSSWEDPEDLAADESPRATGQAS